LKKWLNLLWFLPLLLILPITNYSVDPGGVFYDESEAMVQALMDGKYAYFGTGNGNERGVKQNIIKTMPSHVDCVAIGPSLLMGLRKEAAGTYSFYNLSVSGASFYDDMVWLGMMESLDKSCDRVIICHDVAMLDETQCGLKDSDYYLYMKNIIYSNECEPPTEKNYDNWKAKVEQLFSITYFQSSVDFIKARGFSSIGGEKWGIVEDNPSYSGAYYMPDGSWVYEKETLNNSKDDVLEDAMSYKMVQDTHILGTIEEDYEMLIKYLTENGVEVTLFMCPYAPELWDIIQEDSDLYPSIWESEQLAYNLADKYGIKITGSYNPYEVGISNEDFYDARHVRHELLSTYFDFR